MKCHKHSHGPRKSRLHVVAIVVHTTPTQTLRSTITDISWCALIALVHNGRWPRYHSVSAPMANTSATYKRTPLSQPNLCARPGHISDDPIPHPCQLFHYQLESRDALYTHQLPFGSCRPHAVLVCWTEWPRGHGSHPTISVPIWRWSSVAKDNVRDRGDPQSKALLGGDRTETARRGCQRAGHRRRQEVWCKKKAYLR